MISKFRTEAELYTDEHCHIVEIHNRDDDEGCSIVRTRVAPGVTTQQAQVGMSPRTPTPTVT